MGIDDRELQDKIALDYPSKSYDLRRIDMMLGVHHLCLIFVIPTKIPKIFKESYENYEHKEYGVGKYKALFTYNADYESIRDLNDDNSEHRIITHTRVFLAPAKAKKLDFVFAVGLDSWLEDEHICSFKIMADDVWYDSNIQNDYTDSQSTQDSQTQKEILEMYFSYGEEMIKLEGDDSRHSNDMNLHIVTMGYSDNEQMEIEVRTQGESFIISATIRDNQALLKMSLMAKIYQQGRLKSMPEKKKRLAKIIKRPQWESVKKAYEEINEIGINDIKKAYEVVFNDEKNKLIKKGEQEWIATQKAREIAEKTKVSQVRYEKVGGEALRYFESDRERYRNTCTLQISYALNFGGMSLHNTIKKREFSSVSGATIAQKESLYILGVIDMREFLLQQWGQPEFKESLYEIKSYDALSSRNVTLLQTLKKLNSKGLVTIGGGRYRDKKYLKGFWHSTLWNTDEFVDVQNDRNINYLGGIDDGVEFLAKELFFWELNEGVKV